MRRWHTHNGMPVGKGNFAPEFEISGEMHCLEDSELRLDEVLLHNVTGGTSEIFDVAWMAIYVDNSGCAFASEIFQFLNEYL